MRRKSIPIKHLALYCLLGIAGLTAGGCKHKKEEESKAGGRPNLLAAEGYVVRAQAFQSDYIASGSLLPNEEINILSEVAGRVTSIGFKDGSNVKQGQVLVTLFNADLKAQIQKLRSQRELQVRMRGRQGELLRIGGISQQEYETTGTQIKTIDADIAVAEAQLRRTSVIAPFSGKIGIRNISPGAVITPTTLIATLQQTNVLKMDFQIPDQYREEVRVGKKVSFTVGGDLKKYTATLSAIDPSADAVTRTLRVRGVVQNGDQKLVPGSFAHVTIPFDHNTNAILIPPQSVIPTNRDKKVAVVRNGKAELVTVKLGSRTNEMVEVVQGLSTGDTILTTGIMQVKPGIPVKVRSLYNKPDTTATPTQATAAAAGG